MNKVLEIDRDWRGKMQTLSAGTEAENPNRTADAPTTSRAA